MPPEKAEIYFDWNATSPVCAEARESQEKANLSAWGNPSSVHASGRRARSVVDGVRVSLGDFLGVNPRDVLFTSGGTEANNLGLADAEAIVTSRIEHASVVRVAEAQAVLGRIVRWLDVPADGRLSPERIAEQLTGLPQGTWVSVMAVNHETGVIQPIRAIADVVHTARFRLHVDAVQGLGKLHPSQWAGADRVSIAAHKIGGPKGIGALLWVPGSAPHPVLLGGAQERGLRPGTVDAGLVAGFGAAVSRSEIHRESRERLAALRQRLETEIGSLAVVNGAGAERVGHVSNLSFLGWRSDELVAALDLEGICVSSGSACSAGTTEVSSVIEAMVGRERASGALRVSLGETTTTAELECFLVTLRTILGSRSLPFK